MCPHRFAEHDLIPLWLAEIGGFDDVYVATEVPFMRDPTTRRPAGRIDLVLASDPAASHWYGLYGLEVQAVYFSGDGMRPDFERLLTDDAPRPPQPGKRRPDWRSSSAKRLMPQLQVKTPTLRRWGKKLAVAVDLPFFEAIGGKSEDPSHDINDGDIIWLVPELKSGRLVRNHWEVLSLKESSQKLLAAEKINRDEFEDLVRRKLVRLTEKAP